MMNKILKLFKVESLLRLSIIFIVFAITGSLSVVIGEYVVQFFPDEVGGVFYWIMRILIIFSSISNFVINSWDNIWRVQIFLVYGKKY